MWLEQTAIKKAYLASFLHRLYSLLLVIVFLGKAQQQSLTSSLQLFWRSRFDKPIESATERGALELRVPSFSLTIFT